MGRERVTNANSEKEMQWEIHYIAGSNNLTG
jgi:hypothetical protein